MHFKLDLIIKGSYYYQAETLYRQKQLYPGTKLTAKREADNPHDCNAVQLFYPLEKPQPAALLGYFPRQIAAILSSKYDLQSIASIHLQEVRHSENRLQLSCRLELKQPWTKALRLMLLATWLKLPSPLASRSLPTEKDR
ncbi:MULTISPECIES: HIRAN domain-containing protein [Thiomicrorhabdus]|uniref:HIRAN domain-containing protein n=1 Tax=Thiomicrorhabdus heinhorstiae TaxID=2748010 RepID=A0ABS0BYD3_9GAMM|nr:MULTISPECIES: HIRAN domain-containing protein [Thiomicrorhabdus]MBF6058404.1 HIRAN domain-containing protein [Thiomicrorhabdus heinhorstiae]